MKEVGVAVVILLRIASIVLGRSWRSAPKRFLTIDDG